ncbi:unnamed protein product [Ostreobium quekettii]|uniref:Uncharacterized protein n=1 Tax=Ostreobium quekettii TaxID=121088 RepID=A0A8S1ITA0_9CHLO|nr:unnamed protein product [Ostreobium quekettii]
MQESPGLDTAPEWNDGRQMVSIHTSSVNHKLRAADLHFPQLVYLEKVKTQHVVLRECTVVSPLALLLFGGSLSVAHTDGLVAIDGWLSVAVPAPIAVMMKALRRVPGGLMEEKIARPGADFSEFDSELWVRLWDC